MKTAEIRSAYLEYFRGLDHTVVPSSSLVPGNDPTLLFTNAGMVQFKEPLLGLETRSYSRATSAQRCVRAGGKHNDLENVGYTARHHTLFEMMGNFSFGDYFKEEAIAYAWEFVSKRLGLDADRLWVTVHHSDDDAENIWVKKIGVNPDRVVRLGDEDNFWSMGDTGPCGPCSEIFYDHGPAVAGGPPGSADQDGDRFIEFWNLVFPQYERHPDGSLEPLPSPGVDTGLGLERTAAIMQGVHTNYEIDVFADLMQAAAQLTSVPEARIQQTPSLKVIADHIRSCSFLIADGVVPGNEGRAYVLRRIIRRALRHGNKLGVEGAFFHKLVAPLATEMGDAYPELAAAQERVTDVLRTEEARFSETLATGMEVLEREIRDLSGAVIPGEVVFKLYDTYGFPADLTADIARERALTIDEAGFDEAMERQRAQAKASSRFAGEGGDLPVVVGEVDFAGYESLATQSRVVALFERQNDEFAAVTELTAPATGAVVLDRTPFYAESGGQVGDTGLLTSGSSEFKVRDTSKSGNQHLHIGELSAGSISVDTPVDTQVSEEQRLATALNHSATHLLHAALREVLGSHVAQRGSLVTAQRLRFDFSHHQAVSAGELKQIEQIVNEQIRRNSEVRTELMGYEDATAAGAMALFGEKYGDAVRVLSMGDGFSVELCGGTHAARTGDIGVLRITGESGIASGVRRIEAATGANALALWDEQTELMSEIASVAKASDSDVVQKITQLTEQNRDLTRQLEQLSARLASAGSVDLVADAEQIDGVSIIAQNLGSVDPKMMMSALDSLKSRLDHWVILLACEEGGKVNLVCSVSDAQTKVVRAGDVVKAIAPDVGAKGGGKPALARAGGGDQPDSIDTALQRGMALVRQALGA